MYNCSLHARSTFADTLAFVYALVLKIETIIQHAPRALAAIVKELSLHSALLSLAHFKYACDVCILSHTSEAISLASPAAKL